MKLLIVLRYGEVMALVFNLLDFNLLFEATYRATVLTEEEIMEQLKNFNLLFEATYYAT